MNPKAQPRAWRLKLLSTRMGQGPATVPGTGEGGSLHSRAASGAARNGWRIVLTLLVLTVGLSVQAQWLTQSIPLKPGWNAVYLHVDASYDSLGNLVGGDVNNPILEVWLWRPAPTTVQFAQTPQSPNSDSSQWTSWQRSSSESSALQRLVPNAAYLVRVATNVTAYTWAVKGKPVAPSYQWTTTGLNLLGFPTVPRNPPSFETFLAQAPELKQNIEIYQYVGGDLGSANPARVFALRTTPVQRGQAFWVRSGNYFNRYYSPFEVALASAGGVDFGDGLSTYSFRLRNLTAAPVTVRAELVSSETPPTGQTNIAGAPPLLVRGDLNTTNLTYPCTNLAVGVPHAWTLAAKGQIGSDIEVVLGLNRSAMSFAPGTLVAGTLRLTDSLGFAQVEVPVTAIAASSAGLWVGSVELTQVAAYLKSYQLNTNNQPMTDATGQYIVSSVSTNLGAVPRPFPLRLILHNPATGNAVLLQRVYCGLDAQTNYIVATSEAALNADLRSQARRISSVHLPWTATNTAWAFAGNLGQTAQLTTTVLLDHNDHGSNPFLHTYHPDHDNLDGAFAHVLPQGAESYSIRRDITLNLTAPADDFRSLTSSGQTAAGDYEETITVEGLARAGGTHDARQFQVRGRFRLQHLSNVPTLTRVP